MPRYNTYFDGKTNRAIAYQVIPAEKIAAWIAQPVTKSKPQRDSFLMALWYILGARNNEVLRLRRRDFYEDPQLPGYIKIVVPNSKAQLNSKQKWFDRTLVISKQSRFMDIVLNYIEGMQPDAKILPISDSRVRQIIYAMTNHEICPYTLRHTRLTKNHKNGMDEYTLKQWKGGGSVDEYIQYGGETKPTVVL